MEQYLEAADKALDLAIANGPQPPLDQEALQPQGRAPGQDHDRAASFASWTTARRDVQLVGLATRSRCAQFYPPDRGHYRFRISASGFQSDGKPVTFRVDAGTMLMADEEPPGRLLRRPGRQADRRRVRRSPGAAEHDPHPALRPGRRPDRQQDRRRQVRGAGAGGAVGGGRGAAARHLAAGRAIAASSATCRRRRRRSTTTATASRSSRRTRWPMPSGSSATSPAARSAAP